MDDLALIRRIAEHDREAFAELYGRYAPRVAGFLRQSLAASKADEIAQEVMLRVWRKAPTYRPDRASPATWIFTIARNARIDALRRFGRAEPDPEDPMWVPAPPPRPDEAAEQRRSDERIREALAELPPGQLEVLERAYLRGQPLSEVAEALNLPLGTVKSRVRLAMERLRVVLVGSDG